MNNIKGLVRWQGKASDYWFFIPMLILMTGNLWGGIRMNYSGMADAFSNFAVYAEDMTSTYIYMFAAMAVAVIYCLYLSRKPTVPERE